MTPAIKVGDAIRLRPGLKNRPWQSRDGRVVEVVNDRLKIRIGVLEHWVRPEELQS